MAVEYLANLGLLDANGKPFSSHVERALRELAPRLLRQFPTLKDEAVLADVLEEAGRKIAEHERRAGPIEKLHGYAWVAIRSVALSRMRRGSMRMERATVRTDAQALLSGMASDVGTADEIERAILVDEILAQLSDQERTLFMWKKAGFSSKEIARGLGSSVAAVDQLFHRLKEKIQRALGVGGGALTVTAADERRGKLMAKATLDPIDKPADKANG
jgi:RNA polymerase sigma factor (sigma-70 family)